jgi:hypothetical protein
MVETILLRIAFGVRLPNFRCAAAPDVFDFNALRPGASNFKKFVRTLVKTTAFNRTGFWLKG